MVATVLYLPPSKDQKPLVPIVLYAAIAVSNVLALVAVYFAAWMLFL